MNTTTDPTRSARIWRWFSGLGIISSLAFAVAFFIDPNDTNAHRETYRALGPRERATPVLSEEHALQRDDRDGWAASTFSKTCWSNNRFKCKAYDDYINPTRHTVLAKISGIDSASMLSCTWFSAPRGDATNPRGDAITQPCSEPAFPGGIRKHQDSILGRLAM